MSVAIEADHLQFEVGYNNELLSSQNPGEDDEHSDELP